MSEVWKHSPLGPEHVQVSSLGRARTLDRAAPSRRDKQPTQMKPGRILSPYISKQGYPTISVKEGDKRPKYSVHRLVAAAFCDGYADGLSVNHIDGDKTNNKPENLEWVSLERNTAHAWEIGLVNVRGDNQPGRKLSSPLVRQIRDLIASGRSCNSIAIEYEVSPAIIYKIRDRKRWASVA